MARSAATARHCRALAHPTDRQLGEFGSGAGDVGAFLTVPIRCCVAHAKDREGRQAGVQVRAEFPFFDALRDDVLEDALEPARPPADTTATFPGKMLAFVEEDPNKVRPIDEGREVGFNQQSQSFGGSFPVVQQWLLQHRKSLRHP